MIAFETLVLKSSPNQHLVAPEGLCRNATPHQAAKRYDVPVADLTRAFLDMIADQPRVERLEMDESLGQYEFVQRSRFFRFPDVITIRFLPLEVDTSTLAIYSRSKVGYGDFGVNRRRVEMWLEQMEKQLPA